MDAKRWLTALILLPLLILVLLKGGLCLFVLVILVVNGLAQWEFLEMFQVGGDKPRRVKAILLGSLLVLSFCTAHPSSQLCPPAWLCIFATHPPSFLSWSGACLSCFSFTW